MERQLSDGRPRKATWIALLLPCSLWIGLLSGMLIGSRFVSRGAGFEAGATVLVSGIAGAIAALLIAAVLLQRLTAERLRITALCALLLSGIAAGLLVVRIAQLSQRGEHTLSRQYAAQLNWTSVPPARSTRL